MSTPSAISLKICVLWAFFLLGIPLTPRPLHPPLCLKRSFLNDLLNKIWVQSIMKHPDLFSQLHALCYYPIASAVSIQMREGTVIYNCIFGKSIFELISIHSNSKRNSKKDSPYDTLQRQKKDLIVDLEGSHANGTVDNLSAYYFDALSTAPIDHDSKEPRNLQRGIFILCHNAYCLRRNSTLCALSQSNPVTAQCHCFGAS